MGCVGAVGARLARGRGGVNEGSGLELLSVAGVGEREAQDGGVSAGGRGDAASSGVSEATVEEMAGEAGGEGSTGLGGDGSTRLSIGGQLVTVDGGNASSSVGICCALEKGK
jgi:hypothetical protein